MPTFIPGLELGELFYKEAVKPVLDAEFPGLVYSAALIGSGSEILGYDTETSTDHHWGPRMMLFLSAQDYPAERQRIYEVFSQKLPHTFHGYPTNFGTPDEIGVRLMKGTNSGPIAHRIEATPIQEYFEKYLGFDPRQDMTVTDWLTCSEHRLLTVTAGRVYHDGLGDLTLIREKLAYYPEQVWRYLLSAQWEKLSEEEAFVGRTGDVGDELGSRVIAARLVNGLMKLCFLMERKYAPYSKWFGTAFAHLDCSGPLIEIFHHVLAAGNWKKRERFLSQAYEILAGLHNDLKITEPLPMKVSRYHGRPYLVIHSETFAAAIRSTIIDEEIRNIRVSIGAVDQFIDNTDILSNARLSRRLKPLWEG
jgi:hypothetical protein